MNMFMIILLFSGTGRCIDLKIPDFINRRRVELMTVVRIQAHAKQKEEYLPVQRKILRVIIKNLLTFIQTDKPLYKPGQTGEYHCNMNIQINHIQL